MSSAQAETFSPQNLTVLGGLMLLAIILGEIVFVTHSDDSATMMKINTEQDIAMRIQPVVVLDEMAANPMSSESAGGAADQTPDQMYAAACQACHTTGIAGAPKLGDVAAWSERLEKGLDMLVSSAINGIGAMPPRGGSQLNDEQIQAVVDYILSESK